MPIIIVPAITPPFAPPADLTDGKGDYTCPAQLNAPGGIGDVALMCWRRTGHDGSHYDTPDKLWWDEPRAAGCLCWPTCWCASKEAAR